MLDQVASGAAQAAATRGEPSAPRSGEGQASRDTAVITSDFETFLKMLTTQVQNQDPLDPMKAEDFAVQLATFSGVEQQVLTNQLLEELIGADAGGDLGALTGWIDKRVRGDMPVAFDGQPIDLSSPIPSAGDRHQIVVSTADGRIVDRFAHAGGDLRWSGRLSDGTDAPPGTYGFALESFEGAKSVAVAPVATYGRVLEVRIERDGPLLVFGNGVELPAADATAVRTSG